MGIHCIHHSPSIENIISAVGLPSLPNLAPMITEHANVAAKTIGGLAAIM